MSGWDYRPVILAPRPRRRRKHPIYPSIKIPRIPFAANRFYGGIPFQTNGDQWQIGLNDVGSLFEFNLGNGAVGSSRSVAKIDNDDFPIDPDVRSTNCQVGDGEDGLIVFRARDGLARTILHIGFWIVVGSQRVCAPLNQTAAIVFIGIDVVVGGEWIGTAFNGARREVDHQKSSQRD